MKFFLPYRYNILLMVKYNGTGTGRSLVQCHNIFLLHLLFGFHKNSSLFIISSALFIHRICIPSSLYDIQQEKSTVHFIFVQKIDLRIQKSREMFLQIISRDLDTNRIYLSATALQSSQSQPIMLLQ